MAAANEHRNAGRGLVGRAPPMSIATGAQVSIMAWINSRLAGSSRWMSAPDPDQRTSGRLKGVSVLVWVNARLAGS
jgi:hypothetical protein